MSASLKRGLRIGLWGHVIPVVYAYRQQICQLEDSREKFRVLADGFFVPAVLLLSLGVITWLSAKGQYAGLKYAFYVLVDRLRPRKDQKTLSYGEYLEKYKPAEKQNLWHYFAPGLYFLVVSLIFNGLFGF